MSWDIDNKTVCKDEEDDPYYIPIVAFDTKAGAMAVLKHCSFMTTGRVVVLNSKEWEKLITNSIYGAKTDWSLAIKKRRERKNSFLGKFFSFLKEFFFLP